MQERHDKKKKRTPLSDKNTKGRKRGEAEACRQARPQAERADKPTLAGVPTSVGPLGPKRAGSDRRERPMKRSKSADPAHDVLGYEREQLDAIFRPETVAVIGATDRLGSVGRTIMWNLVSSPFGGRSFRS